MVAGLNADPTIWLAGIAPGSKALASAINNAARILPTQAWRFGAVTPGAFVTGRGASMHMGSR